MSHPPLNRSMDNTFGLLFITYNFNAGKVPANKTFISVSEGLEEVKQS